MQHDQARPVGRVLAKLPDARRNGQGWIARCPAHDDHRPSLSIAEGNDGRALVKCFAGCTVDAICGALSIAKADLFPERGHTRGMPKRVSPSPKPTGKRTMRGCGDGDGRTFATARDAVAELERRYGPRSATWTYTDAGGDPVGLVVRWNTPTGKDVRPVSRKRDGPGWIIGAMPAPRPLYRLPDLADAPRVYITEGEKAADAARSVGLIVTTSAHGSKSASKTDWTPLAGKECVLLPDNDAAGQRYASEVAAILATLTPTPVVKLVELPDLPPGGDMADFVAARRGDQ